MRHATVKKLSNYEDVKRETSECEQKPIKKNSIVLMMKKKMR